MKHRLAMAFAIVIFLFPATVFAQWKKIAGPVCAANETPPTDISGANLLVGFSRGPNSSSVWLPEGWQEIENIKAGGNRLGSYWRRLPEEFRGQGYTVTLENPGPGVMFCYYAFSGADHDFPFVLDYEHTGSRATTFKDGIHINHTDALILTAETGGKTKVAGFTAEMNEPTFGTAYKIDAKLGNENPTWTGAAATEVLIFRGQDSKNRIGGIGTADCSGGVLPDAERATVQAHFAAAQPGDVICLPSSGAPGTRTTWNASIDMSVKRGLEFRGAGTLPAMGSPEQTRIYVGVGTYVDPECPPANPCNLLPNGLIGGLKSKAYPTMIDGISFFVDPGSSVPRYSMFTWNEDAAGGGFQPVILHHNHYLWNNVCFKPPMNAMGGRNGLVYRNVVEAYPYDRVGGGAQSTQCAGKHDNTNIVFLKNPNDLADSRQWWASPPTKGSHDTPPYGPDPAGLNNIYIEDNQFTGLVNASDCDSSCRMVWRFNFHNSSNLNSHGADSSEVGIRHMEVLYNTFTCEASTQMTAFNSWRGGSHMVFGNHFPAVAAPFTACNPDGNAGANASRFANFRLGQCRSGTVGWPGAYPGNWPVVRQIGWGYNPGDPLTSTVVSVLGNQTLEPSYEAGNTYGAGTLKWNLADVRPECEALSMSNAAKGVMGSTLTISNSVNYYPFNVSTGQWVLVTLSDQVEGADPTIDNTCTDDSVNQLQTWIPISGGKNGTLRLSAWVAKMTRNCALSVTAHFDASMAARAIAVTQLQGLDAMNPIDSGGNDPALNPPVRLNTGTSYFPAPATGTLTPITTTTGRTGELVLHYAALSVPLVNKAAETLFPCSSGVVACMGSGGSGDYGDQAAQWSPTLDIGTNGRMISRNGTSGGTGPDASVFVNSRRYIIANGSTGGFGAGQMAMFDSANSGNSVNGIIAFRAGENTVPGGAPCSGVSTLIYAEPSCLGNLLANYFKSKREYFAEAVDDGAGSGPRANRPPTCTVAGQGYWATDQGSWNMADNRQGVLDRCDQNLQWQNDWYHPYRYPHNDLMIVAGGDVNQWAQQPVDTAPGLSFSPAVAGRVYPAAADTLVVSSVGANCQLTGSTMTTANATTGAWAFTGLGLANGTPVGGCRLQVHNMSRAMDDLSSDPFRMFGTITVTRHPSNVLNGATITPAVEVALSPAAPGDTLEAAIDSGTCGLSGTSTTTSLSFSNLVGTTLGTGCTLRIRNLSNMAYNDATTNAFNVSDSLNFGSDFMNYSAIQQAWFAATCRSGVPAEDGQLVGITGVVARTLQGAGSVMRAAIYDDAGGKPGALLEASMGSTSVPDGGTWTTAQVLMPMGVEVKGGHIYWLCMRDMTNRNGVPYSIDNGNGTSDVTVTGANYFNNPFVQDSFSPHNRGYFIRGNYVPKQAPVLSFIQEPTDTVVPGANQRGDIMPTMTVQITPGAAHVLQVSLASGNCVIEPMPGGIYTTTAASSGLATFTGLGVQAASLPATCQVRIHDMTDSSVADILSVVFSLTAPQLVTGWHVEAHACIASPGQYDPITLSLDSTGGDTVVIVTNQISPTTVTDTPTDNRLNTWMALPIFYVAGAPVLRFYWAHPAATGPNHTFTITPFNGQRPTMCVLVLAGADPSSPLIANTGRAVPLATMISLASPLTVAAGDIVVTGLGTSGGATITAPPAGYTFQQSLYPITGLGYRIVTEASSEQPVWTVSAATNLTINAMVLRGNPNVVAGTMAFSQQPTTTPTGGAFSPPIRVTLSTGALDSLTISVNPGSCGIAAPQTVTATASGATFTGLAVQAALASGCQLKVHNNTNPAMPDIVSAMFDVTSGVLTFVQQPQNMTGKTAGTPFTFTPPVSVQLTPVPAGTVTFQMVTDTPGSIPCSVTMFPSVSITPSVPTATWSSTQMTCTMLPATGTLTVRGATGSGVPDLVSMPFTVNAVTPVLSFSTQPSTTVSGSMISPAVVVHSNPAITTGALTLLINGCGATLASPSANWDASGNATFATLTVNGSGNGCTLSTNATGATNATSSTFNVTPAVVVPVLVWVSQPTTTSSGLHMSPQPSVLVTPVPPLGQPGIPVTLAVTSGTCSVTGPLTVTSEPAEGALPGMAVFDLGANAQGTNCVFTASAPNAVPVASTPFSISVPIVQRPRLTTYPVPFKP